MLNHPFPRLASHLVCQSFDGSNRQQQTHYLKTVLSKMVVEAVMMLDELLPLNMIGIKKVQGGALEDTVLVPGVAFKKTFSYAGFEMQKKTYKNPKIAMLNIELELKAEKENAEVCLFRDHLI